MFTLVDRLTWVNVGGGCYRQGIEDIEMKQEDISDITEEEAINKALE